MEFSVNLFSVFAAFHDGIEQYHSLTLLFSKLLFKFVLTVSCFRDKYIYRRELFWPSCINRKKSYLPWNSVVRKLSQESSWNYACECVFVWMVDTVRVLAMHVLLWVVWTKLHGFWSFIRWINGYLQSTMGRVGVFFVCLWRVRSEEQKPVSYHLSLTFSQQHSVTSICSGFNGGKTIPKNL